MDKEDLIKFILDDIEELKLVASGMQEVNRIGDIPKSMQKLALSKAHSILDKFSQIIETDISPEFEWTESEESQPESELISETKISLEETPEIPSNEESLSENRSEPEIEEGTESFVFIEETEQMIEIDEDGLPKEGELLESDMEEQIEEDQIQPQELPEDEKGTFIVTTETVVQETTTTNEKFKAQLRSATVTGRRIDRRFIQNLRKAININDRYRYQKELFGGNAELMNRVIDQLDEMNSLDEAIAYVEKEFMWDSQSETVADFYALLESRFS